MASVVTGGGKTVFAQMCMISFKERYPDGKYLIVVPTTALLDQWYVSLREDLLVPPEDIACFSGDEKPSKSRAVNLIVINTARSVAPRIAGQGPTFLIVDECHRAGSPVNALALGGQHGATLGLSATPQREYDDGFQTRVAAVLGPIIYEYDYTEAYKDNVIAPFDLTNVRIKLLADEQDEYDKLTKRLAIESRKAAGHPEMNERIVRLLQLRAAVSATATMRIPVAAKIAEANLGKRTILFHERVDAANKLLHILSERKRSVTIYHSGVGPTVRRDNLRLYRRGVFDILICCRALDEGVNVPETSVAIVASSTASVRQRIQRLGRVLRPALGKKTATIYTLYATDQEERRLVNEAKRLEGIGEIAWSRAR